MVKVPNDDDRHVIARIPLVAEEGELVARIDEDGPEIDLVIDPPDTDMYARLKYTPHELRELADQAYEIADSAQRASWTPEFVADVRDRYLPGRSDEEVVARLDALSNQLRSRLYLRGRLQWDAGFMLRAAAGADAVSRVVAALDDLAGELGRAKAERLSPVRALLDELHQSFQSDAARVDEP